MTDTDILILAFWIVFWAVIVLLGLGVARFLRTHHLDRPAHDRVHH